MEWPYLSSFEASSQAYPVSISKCCAGSWLALVEELALPEFTTDNFRLTSESEVRSVQK